MNSIPTILPQIRSRQRTTLLIVKAVCFLKALCERVTCLSLYKGWVSIAYLGINRKSIAYRMRGIPHSCLKISPVYPSKQKYLNRKHWKFVYNTWKLQETYFPFTLWKMFVWFKYTIYHDLFQLSKFYLNQTNFFLICGQRNVGLVQTNIFLSAGG